MTIVSALPYLEGCSAASGAGVTGTRVRAGTGVRRLLRHDRGPLSPRVGHVAVHLPRGRVADEVVERLSAVGDLDGTVALHGAELGCTHSRPRLCLGHTGGEHEGRPDLQTGGRARGAAWLQGVQGLATH